MIERLTIQRSIGALLLAGTVGVGVTGCVAARDRYEARAYDGYGYASPRSDDQQERLREQDRDRRDENRRRYRFPYEGQWPYPE
jgi:hypothetical protein